MELTKDHYLELKDGIFDGTTQDDLNNLMKKLETDPDRDHIVLHFHGGLVDKEHAMQTAGNLMQRYQGLHAYQIFFIWETGINEVIQQEGGLLDFVQAVLEQIGQEEIFQQLLMRVLQFAIAKVENSNTGSRSLDGGLDLPDEADIWKELHAPRDGREPYSDVNPALPADQQLQNEEKQQFNDTLMQDLNPTLQDEVQKILRGYRLTKQADDSTSQEASRGVEDGAPTATTSTLFSPSVLEQMNQEAQKGVTRGIETGAFEFVIGKAIEVLSHVLERFAQQTDHGLYITVVEEILRAYYLSNIGKNIWDHIKQEAADAFDVPDRGGSVFLQDLNAYYTNGHKPHITLVGHSAGSIYICQLLQHANKVLPAQVTFDVVFLAPACTYKLFADTLQACKDRIASIRIFAMSDQLEQTDVIVPGVYTRSLLYLVSGCFEDAPDTPILGMQRFFSTVAPFNTWPEVPFIYTYLSAAKHNSVWSLIDTGNGLSSHAKKHGEFYREDVTLTSLAYILTNGLSDEAT